jgi:hypothetical protein
MTQTSYNRMKTLNIAEQEWLHLGVLGQQLSSKQQLLVVIVE